MCANVVEIKSTLHGCRSCDFDVCPDCSSHEFDGRWVTSVGQEVLINGPCIKGSLSLFRAESDGKCSMEIQGVRYFGQLDIKNTIEWDDGDIWTREAEGLRAAGVPAAEPPDVQSNFAQPPQLDLEAQPPAPPSGRPIALPKALPSVLPVQPAPTPAPIIRERHEVAPQWAVAAVADDEMRSPIAPCAAIASGVTSLPPPPMPSVKEKGSKAKGDKAKVDKDDRV